MRAGDRIGEWVVERTLGEGGMGAVYLCHAALSERMRAAVKVLKAHDLGEARERFIREMEALAALDHEAVIRVLGSGEDIEEGVLFMAMEFLEGETLEDRLRRGPFPWREGLAVMRHVVDGLAHAHDHGIRHRDIKPANIMICADGSAKVLDFGIAVQAGRTRLTNDRTVPGTLPYIAPEVFDNHRPDPVLADVYATGVVLYEVVTGRRAYPEDPELSAAQRMAKVMLAKVGGGPLDPGPRFSESLRQLVMWASHPEPGDRAPDMTVFRGGVDAILGGADDELPALEDRDGIWVEPPPSGAFPPPDERYSGPDTGWRDLLRSGGGRGSAPETMDADAFFDETIGVVDERVEHVERAPPKKGAGLGVFVAIVGVAIAGGLALMFTRGFEPTGEPVDDGPGLHGGDVVTPPPEGPGWALASVGYEMRSIAAGDSWIGSSERDPDRRDNETRHPVSITRPYLLGATEVTQALWQVVMHDNPSATGQSFRDGKLHDRCAEWGVGDDLPITCVSWFDTIYFLNSLSVLEGLEPVYTATDGVVTWDREASGYRLPTEAEWEYAANAAQTTRYAGATADEVCTVGNVSNRSTKDRHYAWLNWPVFDCEDGHRELAPVAAYPANAWGLHDMTGNVREWTWDWYAPYPEAAAVVDPAGPETGEKRVHRGGGWSDSRQALRIVHRQQAAPDMRDVVLGLRLARNAGE